MSSGGGPLVFRVAVLSFWHVHAKDYALETKEHPGTEITAVWDADRERGQVEASERGVPFHDDLEGLLSREDMDGVIVTTPTVAHHEVIPAAARAGKHIFVEKVIAPTLSEARTRSSGCLFFVLLKHLLQLHALTPARTIANLYRPRSTKFFAQDLLHGLAHLRLEPQCDSSCILLGAFQEQLVVHREQKVGAGARIRCQLL